jgi:hypothetical protein
MMVAVTAVLATIVAIPWLRGLFLFSAIEVPRMALAALAGAIPVLAVMLLRSAGESRRGEQPRDSLPAKPARGRTRRAIYSGL